MKKSVLLSLFWLMLLLPCTTVSAQGAGSQDLLNRAKEHDGKAVVYKGEVIGDIMARGDHVWLHVNDGYIAVGIWAPKDPVVTISYAGDYKKKGDVVEVSGIFHRSCSEHGGDLDIHAETIKIVSPGAPIFSGISRQKIYLGLIALLFVLLLYTLIPQHVKRSDQSQIPSVSPLRPE